MNKYLAIFLFVLIANQAFGLSLRNKRQTEKEESELDDRYGWNRPVPVYPRLPPMRYPGEQQGNLRPWEYPEFPEMMYPGFPSQGGFPNQGGLPNQGGFPNQVGLPNQGGRPNQAGNTNQGPQFPNQGGVTTQQTTTQSPVVASATQSNAAAQACIRNCPVTSEYNPVCGTNRETYPNIGRLMCAQACGVSVSLMRSSPCPATTPAPV